MVWKKDSRMTWFSDMKSVKQKWKEEKQICEREGVYNRRITRTEDTTWTSCCLLLVCAHMVPTRYGAFVVEQNSS